jgi:hypothetical protein
MMATPMGPKSVSPTRDTAMGLEEFRGDTVGTVWATTVAEPRAAPTPTRLLKTDGRAADRWSRLRTAAFEGKLDEVTKLSNGCTAAELDSPDKAGWTALMYAARGGHLEIARLLLERGASVNASNSKGWTPLMFASWLPTPNEQLVRCLMQAGADASARNNAGLSCADEARSQQNEGVADLLDAESGANPRHSVAATPPRPSPPGSGRRSSRRGSVRAAPGRPTTMGVEQRLRCLGSVPFLKPLTGGERRRLARVVEVRSYAAGEVILRQGDEGSAMFILMFGAAEATVSGVGLVQVYSNGDSFGELALLTTEPRGATVVVTSTEAVCACLHRKQFELLVGKLGNCMSELRRRLRANAYFDGKADYERLFHHYDRDNSGVLDWEQFRSAVRRDGQVTTRAVSERQLRILFDLIDLDGNGALGKKEFVLFISSSMKGATVWSPSKRHELVAGSGTDEHETSGGSGHSRMNSGTLTEQQRQEKHRRELAQREREREQKQRLRAKERDRERVIAETAAQARDTVEPEVGRPQPLSSAWREVPATDAATPRSSPTDSMIGTTESGSKVSPVPVAQTPPGHPPEVSANDDTDINRTSSSDGQSKRNAGRASEEGALWTPRTAQERRVTVNLRRKNSELETANARLEKELQEALAACAVTKEEGSAMVLRLRQAGKDLERERSRADNESRARSICEGERDAATKMARAATDKLAEIERKRQQRKLDQKKQQGNVETQDSADEQPEERRRSHSPRQPEEEHHWQEESSDSGGSRASNASMAVGTEVDMLSNQLETERAALKAAQVELLESEEKNATLQRRLELLDSSSSSSSTRRTTLQDRGSAEAEAAELTTFLRRSLSPQPERGDLSSPVQSLEELEQQWHASTRQQTSALTEADDTAPAQPLAQSEQEEAPGLIEVVCPAGVGSGDRLTVEIGDEETLEVEVPPGIGPGDAFLVDERRELGRLETYESAMEEVAAAALEAAEARAEQSERELGEVMVQVGAVLQRRKEDEAKLEEMEAALMAEKEGRATDQAGLSAYLERVAGLKQSLAAAEQRAAQSVQELEHVRAQLAEKESELQMEQVAHGAAKDETERLMDEARNNAADVAEASEMASAALLAELRMEQTARKTAEDEAQRLRTDLTSAQQESEELVELRERIEQEQAVVAELQTSLEVAENKVLAVVEETASAVMSARAEEAALAVVNARRDLTAENEELTAKAVIAERTRLEAVQEESSKQAAEEIAELKEQAETQALQEREAVTLWEGQEAALLRQLEEAESDLAEVTQAYPLALEEAKASLAEAHALEMQALRDEPQPEPENTEQINELMMEVEQLKAATEAHVLEEKVAVQLWEEQEALLAKQLEESQRDLKAADEAASELEARSTAAAAEIAELKEQAEAQALQEREAVTLWEGQEAALLRQLEEAEGDLAELTQAYPLALEEAKASLAEAHQREMEVATGVSALVSAEPAPMAELTDEERIEELQAEVREKQEEIEELYEIHEQRSQQISALEQDVLHAGQQLSGAQSLNEIAQADLAEARAARTAALDASEHAAMELERSKAEFIAAIETHKSDAAELEAELLAMREQHAAIEAAPSSTVTKLLEDERAALLAAKSQLAESQAAQRDLQTKFDQLKASTSDESSHLKQKLSKQQLELEEMEHTVANHRESLQSALKAHAAELETLSQAHAAELAATRDEASKGSETAQAALRNVRVMLTPVKGDASAAAAARVPETPPPPHQMIDPGEDNTTAALEAREAAALQQVEELRARLEQMEKMHPLPSTDSVAEGASSGGSDGAGGSVLRSRSSEMAYNVRAMLSGLDVNTPVRSAAGAGTAAAPSAEELQDAYLQKAVMAAEIARSNTPNTAKRKQAQLDSIGAPVTTPDPSQQSGESSMTAEMRQQREEEIQATLDAGMISPAEATKMLLHHKLEASLTPVKDDCDPFAEGGSDKQPGSPDDKVASWDQLSHSLDTAAFDDGSDPFRTSSEEDERPLSPVLEQSEQDDEDDEEDSFDPFAVHDEPVDIPVAPASPLPPAASPLPTPTPPAVASPAKSMSSLLAIGDSSSSSSSSSSGDEEAGDDEVVVEEDV